jgi:hypothetical protein
MIRTITFELEKMPLTCFECNFAQKKYCWASCPFLETSREDGEPTPKDCPLKLKNKNKKYNFK